MRGPTGWEHGASCPEGGGCLNSGTPAVQSLTARGQWAVQLVQCTAPLPGGSGHWNSSYALPHCSETVGGGTPAMRCSSIWGQWAMQLLQYTASQPGGIVHCNSCNAISHRLLAVGKGSPAMHGPTSWGDGQSCLGGHRCPKSGTPTMQYHTVWGQWAVQLLQCPVWLPGGSGQWKSCNALPHYLGAAGSATFAMHCHTAWNSYSARAHQLGGREILATRRSLPKERNSCDPAPHYMGAVGR